MSVLPCSHPSIRCTLIRVGVSVGVPEDAESFKTCWIGATGYIVSGHFNTMLAMIRRLHTCPRIQTCMRIIDLCHTDLQDTGYVIPARSRSHLLRGRASVGNRWGRTVLISSLRHEYLVEGKFGDNQGLIDPEF